MQQANPNIFGDELEKALAVGDRYDWFTEQSDYRRCHFEPLKRALNFFMLAFPLLRR